MLFKQIRLMNKNFFGFQPQLLNSVLASFLLSTGLSLPARALDNPSNLLYQLDSQETRSNLRNFQSRNLSAPLLIASVDQEGMASWYGGELHGNYTASGEIYDSYDLTAAHPYLPFGTMVRVINPDNGQSVVVRINDRGPFSGGRIIDLSAAAADVIGITSTGVGFVQLDILSE